MGQCGKIAGEEVNGKGQSGGGVDDSQHHNIVEEEACAEDLLQEIIAAHQHQENRDNDIVDVDEQAGHKANIQYAAAAELEAGETIRRGKCHHQQNGQRQGSDNDGIEHIVAHPGLGPGIHKVLPVEASRQSPGVAVELAVLLHRGHEYPCHGNNDGNSQCDQGHIDERFDDPFTGALFFYSFHSRHLLRIPAAHAW